VTANALVSARGYRYAAAMPVPRTRVALIRFSGLSNVARRTIVGCAVLAMFFASACNRSEREPSPVGSATPSAAPVVVEPSAPSSSAAASAATAQPKAEPGTSTVCNTDADCRMFSDACGACACRPLAKTSPDTKCASKRMSCLVDPCAGQRVYCRKGNCMLGDPGDAAVTGATTAASKDASSGDGAAKDAGSAAPTASAAPKAIDAARRD